MRSRRRLTVKLGATLAAATMLVGLAPTIADAHDRQSVGRDLPPVLRDVARANARYHSVRAAERAGYSGDIVPMCMDHPDLGGMGVHWIHFGLLTDGEITPTQPEAMVYELAPNGEQRLVAVEWVMPPNADHPPQPDGGTGPTLFGQDFTWHPTLGVWKLHAWLYRPNPSGMFADYNPAVASCPSP